MAGKRALNTVVNRLNIGKRSSTDSIAAAKDLKRATPDRPVYSEIVDRIQQLIESGELGRGDQLLSERELAEQFQVSRTSIRRALAVLAGRGIIEVSPRSGAYVRHPSARDAMQPWIQAMLREQDQVSHLAEVRLIVEVQAARLAAERRDEADVQRLWGLHDQVEKQVRDGHPADRTDTVFHVGIVETAKNPFLTELIAVLASAMMQQLAPSWRYLLTTDPAEAQRYISEHRQIVQAIADQNADRAAQLMSEHIRRSHQLLVGESRSARS
jgi:GntR family transcriptional repressor for pyruvate dehydrogenase complex